MDWTAGLFQRDIAPNDETTCRVATGSKVQKSLLIVEVTDRRLHQHYT